ncbi:MAG: hypothetical protein WC007_15055 [Pelobacteraceae bacterium]
MKKTITKYGYDIFEDTPEGGTIIHHKGDDFIQLLPDGTKLVSYEMTFSEDEKEQLHNILNKFDNEPVKKFTGILEALCRVENRILIQPKQTKKSIDEDITDLLSLCKRAAKKLHKVSRAEQVLIPLNKVNFSLKMNEAGTITRECSNKPDVEWWAKTMMKATSARNGLLDFIECFEPKDTLTNKKTGRPKGADCTGLVKEIVNAYNLCFDILATEHSATFQEIVLFALEATGHTDLKDPTRKIKHALSKT